MCATAAAPNRAGRGCRVGTFALAAAIRTTAGTRPSAAASHACAFGQRPSARTAMCARARAESLRRQMASGAGADGISEVLDSPVISDLKAQRAGINRRVAELETKLGPQHPELISARNEAADIERQINAEVQRIAGNIDNELRVAQSQINSIQGSANVARVAR